MWFFKHKETEDEIGKREFVETLIKIGHVNPEDKDKVLEELLNTDIRIRSVVKRDKKDGKTCQ